MKKFVKLFAKLGIESLEFCGLVSFLFLVIFGLIKFVFGGAV